MEATKIAIVLVLLLLVVSVVGMLTVNKVTDEPGSSGSTIVQGFQVIRPATAATTQGFEVIRGEEGGIEK